jgi:HEPN domain-containing protein
MTKAESMHRWKKGAQDAIEIAVICLREGKNALALFHCHLAAEKLLKAVYIGEKDTDPPKTHMLLDIALELSYRWTDEEKKQLNKLTTFAVAARYDELEELQNKEPEESVQWWIESVQKLFINLS